MENEFLFDGYESVPVAEYLQILNMIKQDLRFIYEKCLSESSKEITTLKTDVIGSNELIPESSPDIADSVLQLLTLLDSERNNQESGETLSTLLDTVKDEIVRLNQVNKEKENKMNEMKEQIEDVKGELQQKTEKVCELEEELSKIEKEFSIIKAENDFKKPSPDMKQLLEQKDEKITELESKISRLDSEKADSANQKETIRDLQNKIKQLKMENNEEHEQLMCSLREKRIELRDRDVKIQDLENKISDLETAKRRVERDRGLLKQTSEDLKEELQETEKQKVNFENKFRNKCQECKEIKQNNVSKDEIENLKETIKKLEGKIKDKDSRYDSLVKTNKEHSSLIESNKEKLKENEKRLKAFEEEKKKIELKYEEDISKLRAEIEKKTTDIIEMEEIIKGYTEVQANQTDVNKLQNAINFKDLKIEQYEAKVQNFNESFEKKADELDKAEQTIQCLQKELQDIKRLHFLQRNSNILPENIRQPEPKDDIPEWWKKHMK